MNVKSELPGGGPKTDMGNALDDAGIETGSTGIPRQMPQTPERRLNTQPLNKTVGEALGEDTNIKMTNRKNFLSGAEMLPDNGQTHPTGSWQCSKINWDCRVPRTHHFFKSSRDAIVKSLNSSRTLR